MGDTSSGADTRAAPTQTVRLQGYGNAPARQASNIRVGDTLMWNAGATSRVVGVRQAGSQLIMRLRGEDGVVRERRFGRNRLLAVR